VGRIKSANNLISRTVDTCVIPEKVSMNFNVPSQPVITNRYVVDMYKGSSRHSQWLRTIKANKTVGSQSSDNVNYIGVNRSSKNKHILKKKTKKQNSEIVIDKSESGNTFNQLISSDLAKEIKKTISKKNTT